VSPDGFDRPGFVASYEEGVDRAPPPGRQAIVLAAVVIGLMLLGVQLWLLTVALDLYLSGEGSDAWILAVFSGLVLVGGLWALRVLSSWPRPRR
jgi:hypothetical protein